MFKKEQWVLEALSVVIFLGVVGAGISQANQIRFTPKCRQGSSYHIISVISGKENKTSFAADGKTICNLPCMLHSVYNVSNVQACKYDVSFTVNFTEEDGQYSVCLLGDQKEKLRNI